MKLRLLLLAGLFLSTAACSVGHEVPGMSPRAGEYTEHHRPLVTTRVALSVPLESSDGAVDRDQLLPAEPALPDIAGRWTGVWSGSGVMTRRVSLARAEFTQAGRWGWGTIILSDTLAADVPAIITYRGALGVPVVFDVFQTRVVMKHESGGNQLSAVFRVDGDRMLGALRGYDTLIVLSRQR